MVASLVAEGVRYAAGGDTGLSPSYPEVTPGASVAAGDLLVLTFSHVNHGTQVTATYTLSDGSWIHLNTITQGSTRLFTYYKIATGGESGTTTINVSGGASGGSHWAKIDQYTDVDQTTPIYGGSTSSNNSATVSDADVTATNSGDLGVNYAIQSASASTVGDFTGESGGPGDWTKVSEQEADRPYSGLWTASFSSGATLGGGSYSTGSSGNWAVQGFVIAHQPAASTGSVSKTLDDATVSCTTSFEKNASVEATLANVTLSSDSDNPISGSCTSTLEGLVLVEFLGIKSKGTVRYVNHGTLSYLGGSSNLTPSYPDSIVVGNLLVLSVAHKNHTVQVLANYAPSDGWTYFDTANQNFCRIITYYKIATGDESGNDTVVVSGGAPEAYHYAFIDQYEGADSVSPLYNHVEGGGYGNIVSDTDVTVLIGGDLAVQVCNFAVSGSTVGNFSGETGGDWVKQRETSGVTPSGLWTCEFLSGGVIGGGTFDAVKVGVWQAQGYAIKAGIAANSGNLAKTLEVLSLSSASELGYASEGAISATLQNIIADLLGSISSIGYFDSILDRLTLFSRLEVPNSGTLDKELGQLVCDSFWSLDVDCDLFVVLEPPKLHSLIGTGGLVDSDLDDVSLYFTSYLEIRSSINKTLDDLVTESSAIIDIVGYITLILEEVSLNAGVVKGPNGYIEATLDDLDLSSSGFVPSTGRLIADLRSDYLESVTELPLIASFDGVLDDVSFTGLLFLPRFAQLSAQFEDVTTTFTSTVYDLWKPYTETETLWRPISE